MALPSIEPELLLIEYGISRFFCEKQWKILKILVRTPKKT